MLAKAGPLKKEDLGDEGTELQVELQTLIDEIDSVVHMVIGHELRNPLMKSLEATEKGSRNSRQGWSAYLVSTMEYLVAQLGGVSTRIADLRNYMDTLLALRAIITATEDEVKPADSETQPSSLLSPTTPLYPPSSLDPRSNPSSAPNTPITLLPNALRRLNLDPNASPPVVLELKREADAKIRTQHSITEKAFIDTVGKSLAPQQADALKVLNEVYASSGYGSVRLVDGSLDAKVGDLERRVDELAPKVAAGGMD
jgi:hypothetical protein